MADNQRKRNEFLHSAVGPPYKKGEIIEPEKNKCANRICIMPVYLPLPRIHERRKDKYSQKRTAPPSPQHTPPHTCLPQLSHPHNTTTAPLSPSHRAHDTRKSMEHVPNPDERAGSASRSPQRGDFSIRMINYHC